NVKDYAGEKGCNLQEGARELRYGLYEETAEEVGATRIALGHHADDQAETVLMRLIRGAGRKGLTGIPPVRGRIVRPLIETERREIEAFLSAGGVSFMTDSSNLRVDYFRNWVRRSLMEEIRKQNPAIVRDLCRTADILREEDEYLEIIVTKTLMRLISRKTDCSIELFLSPLAVIEVPLLRRILRRAIGATQGLRRTAFVHIDDMMKLIRQGRAGDSIALPGGVRVIREYSLLKITVERPPSLSEYELLPPGEVVLKEAGVAIRASLEKGGGEKDNVRDAVLLDAAGMSFPLIVRPRRSGDFFFPAGFGKKKKLQDFFVDEKIPRDQRDVIPLVLSGNDIIWVAGYRADERFRVTGKTERYLRLSIISL
ncbi:MAG: tRNA lysidine(34) synthetase TilS, partial [Nitrospiraceae bacterium]